MDPAPLADDALALLRSLPAPSQPEAFYAAFAEILQRRAGYRFLTVFVIHQGQTLRVFSTDPAYPTGVQKPMRATPWFDQVVGRGETFLAADADAVRAAFFDHELIASLGCQSVLSVPVLYDGRCLGALNLNHRAHHYQPEPIAAVQALAPTAIPAFLHALQQQTAAM